MKQVSNRITLGLMFLVGVGITFNTAQATEYAPSEVEMQLQQLSENVYYAQGKPDIATANEGFISNITAVITTEGIVVVDALATPSLAVLFLQKLKQVSDQPVVKVITTHYHADHIYGLQVFKEQGAKIVAPLGFQDYLDLPIASSRLEERQVSLYPWVDEETYLVMPDEVIGEDTNFSLGGVDFQINYLGRAHSDGDLSVLIKPDKVLISGDIIFEGRVPFTGSADTRRWLALLESLDNTGLEGLIPGHGQVGEDPMQMVNMTRRYLQVLRSAMQQAVDDFVSFDEAYEAADWSEFEQLPAFAEANRLNAYGVFISIEKESLE